MAEEEKETIPAWWPTGHERMRRKAPPERINFRRGEGMLSVKNGFSDGQLKEIGAIILEWNELD